jgi:hypothetical protein
MTKNEVSNFYAREGWHASAPEEKLTRSSVAEPSNACKQQNPPHVITSYHDTPNAWQQLNRTWQKTPEDTPKNVQLLPTPPNAHTTYLPIPAFKKHQHICTACRLGWVENCVVIYQHTCLLHQLCSCMQPAAAAPLPEHAAGCCRSTPHALHLHARSYHLLKKQSQKLCEGRYQRQACWLRIV